VVFAFHRREPVRHDLCCHSIFSAKGFAPAFSRQLISSEFSLVVMALGLEEHHIS
jgi:hypothetical protein